MASGFPPTPDATPGVLRVEHDTALPDDASALELKLRLAARVRADSAERGRLTPTEALAEVLPAAARERLGELLAAMGRDARFADIKAVITGGGAASLYSERHLPEAGAVQQAFAEECRQVIAARVRADSRHRAELTPVAELEGLLPAGERARLPAILAGLDADPRYFDLRLVAGAGGEAFLHSDAYLSPEDAALLAGGGADPGATVAGLVREASRLHPRPLRCKPCWARAFGVEPGRLDAALDALLRRPGCADLARLVHPQTGAVYLYSTRYLDEARAFAIMDWEEVGRAENP